MHDRRGTTGERDVSTRSTASGPTIGRSAWWIARLNSHWHDVPHRLVDRARVQPLQAAWCEIRERAAELLTRLKIGAGAHLRHENRVDSGVQVGSRSISEQPGGAKLGLLECELDVFVCGRLTQMHSVPANGDDHYGHQSGSPQPPPRQVPHRVGQDQKQEYRADIDVSRR